MADSVEIAAVGTRERYGRGSGWWAGPESARTPIRFRDRVINQFRHPQNVAYLRTLLQKRVPAGPLRDFALATLDDAVYVFSESDSRAIELLQTDPVAQRGELRPAVGLWGEVRRLNRAFFEDRLAFLRDQAHTIEERAPRDGIDEDEEPYHMRMFVSDSLRPPGLEHLNTPGPLYALREDQSTWVPGSNTLIRGTESRNIRVARGREGFASRRGRAPAAPTGDADVTPADMYLYDEGDAPWSRGQPNRTPEQAVAEYWGDNWTVSETTTGAPEQMGQAYGGTYAWGTDWSENGGTRFQRFESIPFWQRGGREGYDYDIEETLGTAGREMDNHVRRWDLSKLRDPRGQDYRRYGARSAHID